MNPPKPSLFQSIEELAGNKTTSLPNFEDDSAILSTLAYNLK